MKKLVLLLFCVVLLVSLTDVAHAWFWSSGGKGHSRQQGTSLPSNVCVFNFDSVRYDGDQRNGQSNDPRRGWGGVGLEASGGSPGSGPIEIAAAPAPAPVPEPATMLLLGAGLIGLASFGRRKLS